jgi:hypothetical protein
VPEDIRLTKALEAMRFSRDTPHVLGAAPRDPWQGSNGPVIRVTRDSVLSFERLRRQETNDTVAVETVLKLWQGRILDSVKLPSTNSIYRIYTGNACFELTGGEYDLNSLGHVELLFGEMTVIGPGWTNLVKDGQTFDADTQRYGQREVVIPRQFDADLC